jgi:hypothetical protein
MRQRILFALAAVIAVAGAVLAIPQRASALSATVDKGKSDCNAIELGITLIYRVDDSAGSDQRDYFRLEVYDNANNNQFSVIKESITQQQSPFYWQTGKITGSIDPKSLYRIDVYDTDEAGNTLRRIERVYFQCSTQNMWRDAPPAVTPAPSNQPPSNLPAVSCWSWTPIWTTNRAPEKGAVIFTYAYQKERGAQEVHLQVALVNKGDTIDYSQIEAPCGVYLRLYYQPDSTKLIYYMPSQFWPHDLYGTIATQGAVGVIYNTFFPLNGPARNATATPLPTATKVVTLTPTP